MKKLTIFSLCVPILAIGLWLSLQPTPKPPSVSRSRPANSERASRDSATKREGNSLSPIDDTSEDRLLAKHAQLLSAAMTPQAISSMVEKLHEMKKPFYGELFTNWKLDSRTIARVWDQVKKRDSLILALRADTYGGMTTALTTEVSRVAAAGLEKQQTSEAFDDLELIAILGPARFEELKGVDQRVKSRLLNMNAIDD